MTGPGVTVVQSNTTWKTASDGKIFTLSKHRARQAKHILTVKKRRPGPSTQKHDHAVTECILLVDPEADWPLR